MVATEMQENQLPDFVGLKVYFDKSLTPGQRAELRRIRTPEETDLVPAYYHLIRSFLPVEGGRISDGKG